MECKGRAQTPFGAGSERRNERAERNERNERHRRRRRRRLL